MTSPTHRISTVGPAVALVLTFGCAHVQRVPTSPPPTFATRDLVEVWRSDSALRLHAVRIRQDTLTGVSYLQPTSCDSCRVGVPMADVDSLRAGATGERTTLLVLGGVAALLAIFAITFQSGF